MRRAKDVIDPQDLDAVAELPPLVPLADVAKFFKVDPCTIRTWVAEGRLRSFKTAADGSGRVRFVRNEIARVPMSMRHRVAFPD